MTARLGYVPSRANNDPAYASCLAADGSMGYPVAMWKSGDTHTPKTRGAGYVSKVVREVLNVVAAHVRAASTCPGTKAIESNTRDAFGVGAVVNDVMLASRFPLLEVVGNWIAILYHQHGAGRMHGQCDFRCLLHAQAVGRPADFGAQWRFGPQLNFLVTIRFARYFLAECAIEGIAMGCLLSCALLYCFSMSTWH